MSVRTSGYHPPRRRDTGRGMTAPEYNTANGKSVNLFRFYTIEDAFMALHDEKNIAWWKANGLDDPTVIRHDDGEQYAIVSRNEANIIQDAHQGIIKTESDYRLALANRW